MFLDENKKYNYDLLMGSRFIGARRSVLHFWHMIGNKFITFLFNFQIIPLLLIFTVVIVCLKEI